MQAQLLLGAGNHGMEFGNAQKRMAFPGADNSQKKRMKLIIAETERRVGPDIDMLKEMQRTDPIGKEQWWAFCDCHGAGVRDPGKHPVGFVQDFLDKYSAGMRFTSPRVNMMPELVKEGERRSNFFKEAWVNYCSTFGSGMKDPSKHDESFLVGFMDFLGQRGWMALSAAQTGKMPSSTIPPPPVAGADQLNQQFGAFGVGGYGSALGGAAGTSLAEQLLGPPRLQAVSHLLGSAGVAAQTAGYGDAFASSVAAAGSAYGAYAGTMPSAAAADPSAAAYSLPGTYDAASLSGATSTAYGNLAGTAPALSTGTALGAPASAYAGYGAAAGAVTDPTAAAYAAAIQQYAAAASQHAVAGGAGGYDALSSQLAAALQAYAAGYQTVAAQGAAPAAPQAYALPGSAAGSVAPQAYATQANMTGAAASSYAAPVAPQQYSAPAATPEVSAGPQAYATLGATAPLGTTVASQAFANQGVTAPAAEGAAQAYVGVPGQPSTAQEYVPPVAEGTTQAYAGVPGQPAASQVFAPPGVQGAPQAYAGVPGQPVSPQVYVPPPAEVAPQAFAGVPGQPAPPQVYAPPAAEGQPAATPAYAEVGAVSGVVEAAQGNAAAAAATGNLEVATTP